MSDRYDTDCRDGDRYDRRHGGAYDRGSADAYYRRPYEPHAYTGATYTSERIALTDPAEIEAYRAGYEDTERAGDHKIWE